MKPIITIGSTPVAISNLSIPVVLRSPICQFEENSGSFVFNFAVPLTDEIKQEIGFVERQSSLLKTYKHHVSIKVGSLDFSGQATIKTISKSYIDISLPLFNGSLNQKVKSLNLSSIPASFSDQLISQLTKAKVNANIEVQSPENYQDNTISSIISFGNIISDPDSLFISPTEFVAQQTQKYRLLFHFKATILAGETPDLFVIKNDSFIIESFAFAAWERNIDRVFEIVLDLTALDRICFSFQLHCSPIYTNSASYYKGHFIISGDSTLNIYTDFSFNNLTPNFYPTSNYALGPIYNDNFFENAQQSVFVIDTQDLQFLNEKFPYLNYYVNNSFPLSFSKVFDGHEYFFYNIISPLPYLAYIIKSIFGFLNIDIQENAFENPHLKQLCVFANKSINQIDSLGMYPIELQQNLSDFLPQLKISDFLNKIFISLGIVYSFNHKSQSIRFLQINDLFSDYTSVDFSENIIRLDRIDTNDYNGFLIQYEDIEDPYIEEYFKSLEDVEYKGMVSTFAALPSGSNIPNDCYLVLSENSYYYWNADPETDELAWLFYSIHFGFSMKTPFLTEEELFELTLPANPVMMNSRHRKDIVSEDARYWKIPATKRAGRLSGIKKPDESFYLMFYRGMQNDSLNQAYPLLSNDDTAYNLSPSTVNPLSFTLDGTQHSALAVLWEKYLNWKSAQNGEHTFYKSMDCDQLANFDFLRWYNIKGSDFLITQLRFNISENGISPVEVTARPRVSYLKK